MARVDQRIINLEQSFDYSTVTKIEDPLLIQHEIELWVKRDDLLHPIISGNKWRKLKYILNHALSLGAERLVSMGGAYSNHLHALAYIGKQLDLNTTGIIRGERLEALNPTLQDLEYWGMQLEFVSRQRFREMRCYKHCNDQPGQIYQGYWIAEGGTTELAFEGIAELAAEITPSFDIICIPCGTGTTLAGLLVSLVGVKRVIGFAALKGATFLEQDINAMLQQFNGMAKIDWEINLDYHFGGFARTNNELLAFIESFSHSNAIALDSVYTGKMFYGIYDLIKQGKIQAGQRILAIHTGGLQGMRENR